MTAIYLAVVDDEAPVRIALNRLLRLADYDVAVFASGGEFIRSLHMRHPDCVLLDVHMPGLTGFDVQTKMRAASVDVPVIFITASDDPGIDVTAQQAGCVRLLRKPFSNEVLLAAVDAALCRLNQKTGEDSEA
jgi:FixJ family two-component response regulator